MQSHGALYSMTYFCSLQHTSDAGHPGRVIGCNCVIMLAQKHQVLPGRSLQQNPQLRPDQTVLEPGYDQMRLLLEVSQVFKADLLFPRISGQQVIP